VAPANKEVNRMRGLLIRSPWIERILEGSKSWEIRGFNTGVRGTIALIRSGSGKIVGTCDLVDVLGPLTLEDMRDNVSKSGEDCALTSLPYVKTYAWVLKNARPLEEPIPYAHPHGAIIWVKLTGLEIKNESSRHNAPFQQELWHL
jgi:hypothetical protein